MKKSERTRAVCLRFRPADVFRWQRARRFRGCSMTRMVENAMLAYLDGTPRSVSTTVDGIKYRLTATDAATAAGEEAQTKRKKRK